MSSIPIQVPDTDNPSALGHIQVIELGDIPASYTTRALADLGANVIKIEPPGGDPNRWLPPFAGNVEHPERSLTFINANTNKRSIVLDLTNSETDRKIFSQLLASSNLFIEATPLGYLEDLGFPGEMLLEINPKLVTVSLTPFGRTGPYRTYKGSDAIANASGGFVFVQGDDTMGPCTAPSHQGYQVAGFIAATLAVAGIRHARHTGAGQRIDVSLQEALTFTNSSSIARYSLENNLNRRPGAGASGGSGANIYRCKDGRYIHFTAGQPNMWREITANWMPDNILTDPEWQNVNYRAEHAETVSEILSEFIGKFTADDFVEEAQSRHLPAAQLNTIGQFVDSEQLEFRNWLQEIEHPVIGNYTAPGYPMRLSVTPMKIRMPAPMLDQHRDDILFELDNISSLPKQSAKKTSEDYSGPMLAGIRMADLTRQFAGPLGTSILGYYGMEVIKIESNEVPTPGRDAALHADMNRAKFGVTFNLRPEEGKTLFKQLVASSQVVVDNFSSGVMDRLGLGFEELQKVNPGIIQAVMPGWGLEGPLQSWVAWGWQLLAYNGLMSLWGYPDSPMEARCKVAWSDRVGAVTMTLGVVSAIEYQETTGVGQFIEVPMLEAQGSMLGPAILDYTVNGKEWETLGYDEILGAPYSPYGCYPCNGEDNWIIVACETDSEWDSLRAAMGNPSWSLDPNFTTKHNRKQNSKQLDKHITEWTKSMTYRQAFRILQEAGVPSGIPMSAEDLYYDPHLRDRGHIITIEEPPWGTIVHHGLPGIPSLSYATAQGPAPWIGDHNELVLNTILGVSPEEISKLEESGALK